MLAPVVGVPVPDWEVYPLPEDASDRCYFRIILSRTPANTRFQPPSLVLMKLAQAPSPPEILFVNVLLYLQKHHIPVPDLHAYNPEKGMALLEDLGDMTLEKVLKKGVTEEEKEAYYRQAIDLLLRMQMEGSRGEKGDCAAFGWSFDVPKLWYELEFFLRHTVEGLWGMGIAPSHRKELHRQLLGICRVLAAQKRYFTHRDYHSRNIMVQEERLRIIDFQDARMGPCQYDLVSLLRDSYVHLEGKQITDLIEYYLRGKEELERIVVDRQEFERIFDLMALQRNLKALGTFGYQKTIKGNDRYLESIPRTLGYIRESLERNQELQGLREVLEPYLAKSS